MTDDDKQEKQIAKVRTDQIHSQEHSTNVSENAESIAEIQEQDTDDLIMWAGYFQISKSAKKRDVK